MLYFRNGGRMDGQTVYDKSPFTFFIFRVIKNRLHIYIGIYKFSAQIFCGLKFRSKMGSGCKNSKSPSRVDFFIIIKVDLKIYPLLERSFCEEFSIFVEISLLCIYYFLQRFFKTRIYTRLFSID